MFLLNWTKLSKIYWIPKLDFQKDNQIWYASIRFLGLEAVVYSRQMATALIDTLNTSMKDRD